MSTRLSFRPRPLDINRPLAIVRELKDLDSTDGLVSRDITHDHEALDKNNEEAKMVQSEKAKGGKEIPIPEVREVNSWRRDYLPTFKERSTYVRGRGGVGYRDESMVEYDLDSEDERWLDSYNDGQDRLSDARFEYLLWRLEMANAEATDRALSAAGATAAERTSASAVSATEHMAYEEAMAAMEQDAPLRKPLKEAVYGYWQEKRKRTNKPLLRQLQAATSVSDTNPYNVFRPRERINRPQTRRRRENNEESLEKMQTIKQNLGKAMDLLEFLVRRERRKRDLVYVTIDWQQLQIKLRHDPRHTQDGLESEYLAAAKSKPGKRPVDFDGRPRANSQDQPLNGALPSMTASGALSSVGTDLIKKQKKRKRDGRAKQATGVAQLPPPPVECKEEMLFTIAPDLARLISPAPSAVAAAAASPSTSPAAGPSTPSTSAGPPLLSLPATINIRNVRPRLGRNFRLVLDRADAVTYERFGEGPEEPGVVPMHELPNPYLWPRPRGAMGGAGLAGPPANGTAVLQGAERGGSAGLRGGPSGEAAAANGTTQQPRLKQQGATGAASTPQPAPPKQAAQPAGVKRVAVQAASWPDGAGQALSNSQKRGPGRPPKVASKDFDGTPTTGLVGSVGAPAQEVS